MLLPFSLSGFAESVLVTPMCILHTVRFGSSMDLPEVVPVCPPGPESVLAQHLRVSGWIWDDDSLLTVVGQLAQEDVCVVRDLVGLDIADIAGSAQWPPEVTALLQEVVHLFS